MTAGLFRRRQTLRCGLISARRAIHRASTLPSISKGSPGVFGCRCRRAICSTRRALRVEGGSAVLQAAPDGGPLLTADAMFGARVRYRTGEGLEIRPVVGGSWPSLPEPADAFAVSLQSLPIDEAARAAGDWVRRHVVYDTSEQTVRQHRVAADNGIPFAARCLTVGAGDCDVQNALLAAILARSGITVRLAVGFVGARGRCLPGLHAWVEYRGANRIVADG